MKNKKIKFGALLALFGAAVGTVACVANTQLNANKANSIANNSSWTEETWKVIAGSDTKGSIDVEMYVKDNGQKAIKLTGSNGISVDNGAISYVLRTLYDGDVRVETIGANALKGHIYVRGTLNASSIINIDNGALMKTGITQLTISNMTTYIGKEACRECKSLTSIVVENAQNVKTEIGENAFTGCNELKEIKIGSAIHNQSVYECWAAYADKISEQVGHEVKVVE